MGRSGAGHGSIGAGEVNVGRHGEGNSSCISDERNSATLTAIRTFFDAMEETESESLPAAVPILDQQGATAGLSAASAVFETEDHRERARSKAWKERAALAVAACQHVRRVTQEELQYHMATWPVMAVLSAVAFY